MNTDEIHSSFDADLSRAVEEKGQNVWWTAAETGRKYVNADVLLPHPPVPLTLMTILSSVFKFFHFFEGIIILARALKCS